MQEICVSAKSLKRGYFRMYVNGEPDIKTKNPQKERSRLFGEYLARSKNKSPEEKIKTVERMPISESIVCPYCGEWQYSVPMGKWMCDNPDCLKWFTVV